MIIHIIFLNIGIIALTKVQYKTEMVARLVKAYSGDFDKLKKTADEAKAGYKGLDMGCKANVLDAAILIDKCWNSLTSSAIANCWKHANILPAESLPGNPAAVEMVPSTDEGHLQSISDFEMVITTLLV